MYAMLKALYRLEGVGLYRGLTLLIQLTMHPMGSTYNNSVETVQY